MENQHQSFASLFENASDYIETRIDLLKLKAISKSSDIASSVVSRIAILLLVCFALFVINIGLALWIGHLTGKTYLGFFIVGGFYGLIAVLLHFLSDSWLKQPVSSMIIKKLLN